MRALFRRIRARYRPMRRRDRGVAMLVVLTWLALMISLVGQFTYGTTVDAAQAANARDELRAHYLARSGGEPVAAAHQDPAALHRPGDGAGEADAAAGAGRFQRQPAAAAPPASGRSPSAFASPTTRAR